MENTLTIENLKELYFSKSYQDLLLAFEKESRHKLEKEEDALPDLEHYLSFIHRRFMVLDISFEEVVKHFEKLKDKILYFTIRSIDFFADQEKEINTSLQNEPEDDENGGVSRTFFLDKFCEAYLLNLGDRDRLLHYLTTTRMPQAEEYLKFISHFYFTDK